MASLTHVCMWTDKGWKPITVEEASELHPGGTVSAKSGLFMCELCDQYVTLTDGDIRTRYFKHSSKEADKNCPDRLKESNHSFYYNPQEHDLPIRITNVSQSSFQFEVGLIRVPINLLTDNLKIEIVPEEVEEKALVYSRERINSDCITYLYLGEKPFKKYTLTFLNGDKGLRKFWPKEIIGIDPDGTLFEKNTGKKLARGAEVEVNKEYYLLRCLKSNSKKLKHNKSIHIQQICTKNWGKEVWKLYLISASVFDQKSAKFYFDFHCRLTEHPVSINPVWPLFIEGDCLIKYSSNPMYLSVEGQSEKLATFPFTTKQDLAINEHSKLYEVFCSSRQQLISTRRNQKVLDYAYFWREPLDQVGFTPKISVRDLEGNEIGSGETNILPKKNILQFHSTLDGEIIIFRNEKIEGKLKLFADTLLEVDNLSYDVRIQAMIGLDKVWSIDFKKSEFPKKNEEESILKYVKNTSGPYIITPHSLRALLKDLDNYPNLYRWIRKCIKNGLIKEQSYRRLQEVWHYKQTDEGFFN